MNSSGSSMGRADRRAAIEAGSAIIAGSVVAAPFMILVAAVWALSFADDDRTFVVARHVAPIVLVVWALALCVGTAVYVLGRTQRGMRTQSAEVTDRTPAGAASS